MPCFVVADIAATVAAAERAGALVEQEPQGAPDGAASARIVDPSGSRFGLISTAPTTTAH